ncbi:MAG: hypothetical protein KJ795_07560 [Gammaproteobacteria bacterium]|nr:hypothetical protein [Gammaproteobacteria bacterium]MBU1777896.1 hypothetical protein [Gammaproteobacteria bacterium]MBU1969843.1 hypothetical protein [Gammaproteobacteria bacterium]
MSRPSSSTAVALLSLVLCQPACAADANWGVGGYLFASHDTEGFDTHAVAMEYLPRLRNADNLTGVKYTRRTFSQQKWKLEADQVSFMGRAIDPATANGWQLDAGLSRQGHHDMLTLDGSYHLPLAAKTGLDLFMNLDWVETRTALEQGINFAFIGASLDQGIGDHWTVVGMAGEQDFSDSVTREHFRAKVVYQPMLDSGLTLQLRYRSSYSDTANASGTYFNPAHYDEILFAAGWRKRIQGWVFRATAGAGTQHVNSDPGSDTRLLELALDSPSRGTQFIRVRGGHNQSASFGGPNYRYTYLQGEWIFRL